MLYILLFIVISISLDKWQRDNKGALGFWFLIPAAIAAVSGIYQAIKGSKQRREANAAKDAVIKQQEQVANQAFQRAQTGLPAEQYQQALRDIQRNQAYAISQLQDRRLGVAGIGAVQQRTNDAQLNLDAQNAEARLRNQAIADQQQAKLLSLKYGTAQDNADYGASLQAAGIQNIGNAVSSASQLGAAGAFSNQTQGYDNINGIATSQASYPNRYDTSLTKPIPRISYRYNQIK